jgi:hypothetical protein
MRDGGVSRDNRVADRPAAREPLRPRLIALFILVAVALVAIVAAPLVLSEGQGDSRDIHAVR